MTSSAALWVGVRKETRVLLPTWAACAGALAVVGAVGDVGVPGTLFYFLGSVALAALSIGHEYTHGTLPLLLSQPSSRRRLLLVKLGVVTPMLVTLGALALATLPAGHPFDEPELIPILSLVCTLLLAPLLTMVCRSPLAGIVFALGGMAWVHMVTQAGAFAVYGWEEATIASRDRFIISLRWLGLLSACAVAPVAGWRMFMRLEAIDGPLDVHWPSGWRWGAAAAGAAPVPLARRQHPLWLLVKKELRLQQMTFVVAGLITLMGIALSKLGTFGPEITGPIGPLAVVYGVMLAWLTGSLASAEERHLGTIEWQTMLPVAAWRQWMVKTAIALGVAILLAAGLPTLVSRESLGFSPTHVGGIVVLTSASLYISSLCGSGLRTLTLSGPVVLVVLLLLGSYAGPESPDLTSSSWVSLAALIALAWRFAFENHRLAGHDVKRVGWQVAWMAALLVAAITM